MTLGTIHASCVAMDGRGLLLLGRPGAGKSTLALELIALGSELVADDRLALSAEDGALIARPPPRLAGLIEARGIGLLRPPFLSRARLALALDLDREETERSPPRRQIFLNGIALPLILRPRRLTPAVVLAALRWGPPLDPEEPLEGGHD